MKFFKHFVDGHSSYSMQALMNEFGLEGYAAYFILIEMCVAKIEKGRTEIVTEDHCRFRFNERVVREKLRMRATKVELFLNSCATLDLLQFTKDQDEFNFYLPKILECLDRQSKRARPKRGQGVSRACLEEEEEKEREEERAKSELAPVEKPIEKQTSPPKAPANYAAFADANDPEKSEIAQRAVAVLTEVLGGKPSPDLRNCIPAMFRAVEWDVDEFARLAGELKTTFDSRVGEQTLNNREFVIKKTFGLIQGKAG